MDHDASIRFMLQQHFEMQYEQEEWQPNFYDRYSTINEEHYEYHEEYPDINEGCCEYDDFADVTMQVCQPTPDEPFNNDSTYYPTHEEPFDDGWNLVKYGDHPWGCNLKCVDGYWFWGAPTPHDLLELLPELMVSTQEEACDVFPTNCEVVVDPQGEFTNTPQQDKQEEKLEEIIYLLEVALVEEALMSYKFFMINERKEEEEEVVQLYELPGKMLHEDEGVKQGVLNSSTPLEKQPHGLREKLEWKIKHRWRIKELTF